MKLVWKKNTGQFESGSTGYRANVALFSYHWDSCRSKGSDSPPWSIKSYLPGIKSDLGNQKDEDGAKAFCEKAFDHFLKMLDLTERLEP